MYKRQQIYHIQLLLELVVLVLLQIKVVMVDNLDLMI